MVRERRTWTLTGGEGESPADPTEASMPSLS
jgi:hypothetical protein